MSKADEVRPDWREQIERGWLQAQAGQVIDGEEVFHKADERINQRETQTRPMTFNSALPATEPAATAPKPITA